MLSLILRLALVGVLKLKPRSLGLLAPVCSSMGFLAASQTKRSFIVPLGDLGNPHVFSGNLLAIRPDVIHLETLQQKCQIINLIILTQPTQKQWAWSGQFWYAGCWQLWGTPSYLNSRRGHDFVFSHSGGSSANTFVLLLGHRSQLCFFFFLKPWKP